VTVPFTRHAGISASHLLPLLLPPGSNKSSFMEKMKAQGIQTSFHYPPTHTFTAYKEGEDAVSLPLTDAIAEREVTLPLYPALRDDDVITVASAVAGAL
jgi:dTDP-4-amino-4,6-dideoxygalactose transaminase